MKTSWLNGSKRILSALLIAAALMFGWTPLGEGKALAATDKGNDLGQQFADAAMLFVRENNYYLNLCNNQNTPFSIEEVGARHLFLLLHVNGDSNQPHSVKHICG